jgi:predicted dienelactone hydrolase
MQKSIFTLALLTCLTAAAAQAAETLGFKEITLPDQSNNRALHVSLWYPSAGSGSAETIGENKVYFGISAVINGEPMTGAHPLVVLSHGYGGSWRNLNWLAAALVQQGYIVAAPDHPGTTSFDRSPEQAAKLWLRPQDLSRVMDAVIADPALAGKVAPERIAAIGHSLGGWTVAELAGARFDSPQFMADCATPVSKRACGLAAEFRITAQTGSALDGELRDRRIGAVVTLDLGLARGFTPESLGNVTVPALVIGAGIDIGGLPSALESGYLAEHLPQATTRYVTIADTMHFSFLQPCKPGAIDLIEEEEPGEGIVCDDSKGRAREVIHHEVAGLIIEFLALNLR